MIFTMIAAQQEKIILDEKLYLKHAAPIAQKKKIICQEIIMGKSVFIIEMPKLDDKQCVAVQNLSTGCYWRL